MQTSFMHPPFGFALFYLRSVAADERYVDKVTGKIMEPVTTAQIYWGAVPFVIIQGFMVGLVITFPQMVMHYKGPAVDASSIPRSSCQPCQPCSNLPGPAGHSWAPQLGAPKLGAPQLGAPGDHAARSRLTAPRRTRPRSILRGRLSFGGSEAAAYSFPACCCTIHESVDHISDLSPKIGVPLEGILAVLDLLERRVLRRLPHRVPSPP